MTGQPIDSLAVIGDAADAATWSGIPYHFGAAAAAAGWRIEPWRLDLAPFRWPRRQWNLGRILRFRRPGGYQYSPEFLDMAEAQIPRELKSGRVLSFNQFFPRARMLAHHGGKLVLYIDATFPRLLDRYGFSRDMDRRTADEALRSERENLAAAEVVVAFQQWTADSLVQECAVDPSKVRVVLPGANLIPDSPVEPLFKAGIAGTDRPLVLGFVGKDWKRKNLPFLVDVARKLVAMGVKAEVHCAGGCPAELQRDPLVKWVGFLDKQRDLAGYIRFLQGCDLGCLFSLSEASSIAVLEFLRVGVPVAGFVVDGMGDLLLPGAAVRFAPGTSADEVAENLADAAGSDRMRLLRTGAVEAMPVVTWERCLRDLALALVRPRSGLAESFLEPVESRVPLP